MSLRVAVVLTLVTMLINTVSLGAVGDILFDFGDGVAIAIFGDLLGDVHGDYYWPIAFWMGIAWPVGALLIFYAMARRQRGRRWSIGMYAFFPVCLLVLVVGLSIVFHVGAAAISPEFYIEERVTVP